MKTGKPLTRAHELQSLGQSLWIDYMRRQFVEDGGLQQMINSGIRGATSNPTIFEKAIAGSADYDAQMKTLVQAGKSIDEIYEALVVRDIQQAADLMRPIYDESDGLDGYVSLEVSPTLAHDTRATIADARHLHALLDRPNVMIKIPATRAGLPAIEQLIGEGISVNVTLMFSLDHYNAVAEAYLSGLEKRAAHAGDLSRIASVASFFVSRVESSVDAALEEVGNTALLGEIAVANAKMVHARFREVFGGERWRMLEAQGARVQRLLWASTGVKNPHYPDTKYVDELIGSQTVNTLPPETLQAFLDHGTVINSLEANVEAARDQIEQLAELGIDLNALSTQLQHEGVEKFAASFKSLMASIDVKYKKLRRGDGHIELFLSDAQSEVAGPHQVHSRFAGLPVMIRAMIFDLDGTLVQTERLKAISYAKAIVELCPASVTEDQAVEAFKDAVGLPRREAALTLMKRFGLTDLAASYMTEFRVSEPWQAFVQIRLKYYQDLLADGATLRNNQWPHNIALLQAARAQGCVVALASTSCCEQVNYVLDALGLSEAFSFVATGDDVERNKPDPEIYTLVSRQLDVPPDESLVIEDSPAGVEAAVAAGMHVIAVTTPFTRSRLHQSDLLDPRWIVDDPADLLSTVQQLVQLQ